MRSFISVTNVNLMSADKKNKGEERLPCYSFDTQPVVTEETKMLPFFSVAFRNLFLPCLLSAVKKS